jgi:hypothetical protein
MSNKYIKINSNSNDSNDSNNHDNPDNLDNINNKVYDYLLEQLKKNRYVTSKSSEYYRVMNLKMVIPSLVMTSIAGIISFISSSDISNDTKNYLSISVGIVSSLSALIQSVNTNMGFSSRCEIFQKCADEYSKLITKVEFEILAPNENYQEFINKIEDEINKIQQSCKYYPPQFIIDDYIKNKNKIKEFENDDILIKI